MTFSSVLYMFVGYVRHEHRITSLVQLDKKLYSAFLQRVFHLLKLYTQIRYAFSVMLNFDCFCQLTEVD